MTDKKIYETKEDAKKAAEDWAAGIQAEFSIEHDEILSAFRVLLTTYEEGSLGTLLRVFQYKPPQPEIRPGTICEFWSNRKEKKIIGYYEQCLYGRHYCRSTTHGFKHAEPFDSTDGLFDEAVELLSTIECCYKGDAENCNKFLRKVEKWKAAKNDN